MPGSSQRRIPAELVSMLARALDLCARGPADPLLTGQSDEHVAGMQEERANQALWRRSWVTPELAAVVAWAEGHLTIQDITYRTSAYSAVVEAAFAGKQGDP